MLPAASHSSRMNLRYKFTESERSERRKCETIFKLAPAGAGLLIDEYPSSEGDARTTDELRWAEGRIQSELRFEKLADENTISYTRDVDGYRVFADIRARGRITFYAYKLPRDAKKRDLSSCSFHPQDRFSRELAEKWKGAFAVAVQELGIAGRSRLETRFGLLSSVKNRNGAGGCCPVFAYGFRRGRPTDFLREC